jgi:hypothetical protein
MMSPPKFLFVQGVLFDTIITPAGVLLHRGPETNPVLSGIQSPGLMLLIFLSSNLLFIPAMLMIADYLNHEKRFRAAPDIVISLIGIVRLACGLTWVI